MGTLKTTNHAINELVFENRNRQYGAYVLRRDYDQALIKSFLLAMMGILSLIAVYKLIPKETITETVVLPKIVDTTMVVISPKQKQIEKQVVKHTLPVSRPVKNNSMVEVTDSVAKVDTAKPAIENIPVRQTGTGNPIIDTAGSTTGSEKGLEKNKDIPQIAADTMPEFPGGEVAMERYLHDNIHFTLAAQEAGLNSTLILKFVVDYDGSINHIEVLKPVGYGCEKQAMKVVEKMPRWKPGKMGKRAVPVYFTLPIQYKAG